MKQTDLDYLATGKRSKPEALRAVIAATASRKWIGAVFARRELGMALRKAGATVKYTDPLADELKVYRSAYDTWNSRQRPKIEGRGGTRAVDYYNEQRSELNRRWVQTVWATDYANGQKRTSGELELGTHLGHFRTYDRIEDNRRIIVLVLPRDWGRLPLDFHWDWVYNDHKLKKFLLWADRATGRCVWMQNEQLSGRNRIDICRGTFGTDKYGGTILTRDYKDKKPRTNVKWDGPQAGQGEK